MDTGATGQLQRGPGQSRPQARTAATYPPDAEHCAAELLSIVAYLTAGDGPLQAAPGPVTPASPWHERLLRKAAERLDVIDAFMRARVAFLAAGKDRGYYAPEAEIELAGATLDATRAATVVVAALLETRLPAPHDFDAMSAAALSIIPALDALGAEAPSPRAR
jgi:hypothetical protein